MPEINNYSLSHRELVVLMIKELGIHEGRWLLSVNFGLTAGNFGPSEDEVIPGAVLGIQHIGIQRETPGMKGPRSLVVDAAEVNPA